MDWLVHMDERLFLLVNGWGAPHWDGFFQVATHVGRGLVLAVLVILPMALLDRAKLRAHLLPMVLSVAVGAVVAEGTKWVVGRDRPARHFSAVHGSRVRMVGRALYERSFPSGHAQAVFGAATYVSLLYPALAVPAIGLAALVGVSRVYLGVHFPLDVIAGAVLGVAFSLAGFRLRSGRASRADERD